MRYVLILMLLLTSCAVERVYPYYHFEAWVESNGMIRVSYSAEYSGYYLMIGCDSTLDEGTALFVKYNNIRGYGEYSFTRICTPMYFRIKSEVADELIGI